MKENNSKSYLNFILKKISNLHLIYIFYMFNYVNIKILKKLRF